MSEPDDARDDRPVRCGNCDWEGVVEDVRPLHEVKHLHARLDPGSEVPAGECPECTCFAYLVPGSPPVPSDAQVRSILVEDANGKHGDAPRRLVGAFVLETIDDNADDSDAGELYSRAVSWANEVRDAAQMLINRLTGG